MSIKLWWYKHTCYMWAKCTQATLDMQPALCNTRKRCPLWNMNSITSAYRITLYKTDEV